MEDRFFASRRLMPISEGRALTASFVTGLIDTWVDKFALFPEILAAAVTAWPASGEKPLTVLRYE